MHSTVGAAVVVRTVVGGMGAHWLVASSNDSPDGQVRGICKVEEKQKMYFSGS